MNAVTGNVLGWLGIVAAVVGFFYAPIWLGIIGIVLGLITLASPQKALAWVAVVLSVITLVIPLFK
ncbi:MAG: C4-dicarboxylate ABC transporter [Bacillota bacterium]|nr:C4-dicarboxylate ABC transporter [Bacillota bacterium]MDP4156125.1 C4-dicarboxylate ABC transporter [Bacillota bacterium]